MKYLLIILAFLLSSCMTYKRVERNCDLFLKVCEVPVKKEVQIIRDTQIETVYRDTVIYVELLGKIIEKRIPVYIKEGIVESDLSILITPLARSTAKVFNSKLEHYLEQSDTTLQLELQDALKTIRILNTEKWKTEIENTVTIRENSPFAKFAIKVFLGLLIVVILGIGYLIYKNKSWLLSKLIRDH